MADLRTISYNTGNLESQGVEYGDLAHNLEELLQELDRIMNEEVLTSVAGTANGELLNKYTDARNEMEKYAPQIRAVGDGLIEAARTGKAIDNSLVGDVSLSITIS